MKRNVFLGALCSTALAVSVAAQTPATPQADQQSSKQQVAVIGCLNSADTGAAAAGTAGTGQATGAAKSEGQFVLTNARVTSGASAATGTAGTGTGTAGAASPAANRFLLVGGNQQELKKNLNSEVEIRGTLQPPSAPGAGAGTGTGTATGGAAAKPPQGDANANLQRLRVTSVKQTAATCSGGN